MIKRTGIIAVVVILLLLTQGRHLLANFQSNVGFLALNRALADDPAGVNPLIQSTFTQSLNHDPHARQGLSLYYLQHNQLPDAFDLLEADPDSPTWLIAWGRKAALDGDHSQALDWYDRATTLAPEFADPYYYAGLSYENLELTEQAIQAYNDGLQSSRYDTIGPSDFYLQLAQTELQSNPTKTIEFLGAAIALDNFADFETEVYAHYLLAETHRDLSQFDEAVDEYQWIIENQNTHYWAHVQMGRLSWRVYDEFELAELLLLKAIDLIENRKAGHKSLAEMYLASGRDDLALTYYQRAAELDPNDTDVQEALDLLAP